MKLPKPGLAVILFTLAATMGCSKKTTSNPAPTPTPTPKPTETSTGRIAFQRMYIQAHGWAPDAQGYLEESQPTTEVNGIDGKSAVWSASFGSPSKGSAKSFTWSGTDAQDAPPRGILPGSDDSFSPTNSSTRIFDLGFLRSDTDQAFKVAQEHGGKDLLAKDPTLPVQYRLEWSSRDNTAAWHVIYGQSKLSVAVNATSGEYLRVDK